MTETNRSTPQPSDQLDEEEPITLGHIFAGILLGAFLWAVIIVVIRLLMGVIRG